jgi:hypothetical protein
MTDKVNDLGIKLRGIERAYEPAFKKLFGSCVLKSEMKDKQTHADVQGTFLMLCIQ